MRISDWSSDVCSSDLKADCARKILLILIHKIGNLSPGSHTGLQLRRTFADPAAMAFAQNFEALAQGNLCQVHRGELMQEHIALGRRHAAATEIGRAHV